MENQTKECKRCHQVKPITEFYTKKANKDRHDSYCKDCCRAQAMYYRTAFPQKSKEIAARTRAKNHDAISARNKEIYAKLKDDPSYKQKRRESRERNKDKYQEKVRERRRLFNEKYKKPCAKCGESRLYLIQFHHIDPTTKEICIGANSATMKEELLIKEVKKCVCLCSNCHDEFHYFYGSHPEHPVEALNEYLGKRL